MDKIGIYVGSFNPPHLGHENIIKYLLNKKLLDFIYIVPVARSSKELIDSKNRYEMLKLLNIKNTKILTEALEYKKHFDYDLLNEIKQKYNIQDSFIIMGLDNLNKMPKWDNYGNILKENKIICIKRNNQEPNITQDIILINNIDEISSTEIRNSVESSKEKLNQKVYNYIIENHLYRK